MSPAQRLERALHLANQIREARHRLQLFQAEFDRLEVLVNQEYGDAKTELLGQYTPRPFVSTSIAPGPRLVALRVGSVGKVE